MIKNIVTAMAVSTFFFLLFSCTHDNAGTTPPKQVPGKFNFGLLRYDSVALEYRLDSIHNRGLILQFCITEAGDNNNAFQLISYAFDTLNDHNNSWMPDTLHTIADSLPFTFTGKITMGNNEVTREQLLNVVRDDNGNRFSYDYLMFVPVVEGVFKHVVYRMQPMKDNKPVQGSKMQMTSPMPPARVWEN